MRSLACSFFLAILSAAATPLVACGPGGSGGGGAGGGGAGGGGAGGAGGDAGSAGAGGGGQAGSGGGVPCATADTCPGMDTACQLRTCDAGTCGLVFVADGALVDAQIDGDCAADVCDGAGGVVSVSDPNDAPDDGDPCTSDVCGPAGPEHPQKDVGAPCPGGFCDAAGACVACVDDGDCPGEVCFGGTCVPMGCPDGKLDGAETDVDCGGPSCPPCGPGAACLVDADCAGGSCTALTCASTCSDGAQGGLETGVDCGGPDCGPCPLGQGCASDADCASGFCADDGACALLNGCDLATAQDQTASPLTVVAFPGLTYSPACIVVKQGSQVQFTGDFSEHPLLSASVQSGVKTLDPAGPFNPITNTGVTKTFVMSAPGAFGYICDFHWPIGMTGAVFVVP